MKIKQIDHIGIIVSNLEEGKRKFGSIGLNYLQDEISEAYSM